MAMVCRDCAQIYRALINSSCLICGGRRFLNHPELLNLNISHIDCDSFYASVEKRDNPDIRGKPVIVGGGRRGVVAACCYIARIYGISSAMPIFKALKACPDAVVIRPNMDKYQIAGQAVRKLMQDVTPLVEPISIDEAFLDLSGTQKLHHGTPAETLVKLANRIESEVGINVSIGLSYNKFLAKLASNLDKPRGFAAIGQADAMDFLEDKPVGILWGVGRALQKKLDHDRAFFEAHGRHPKEFRRVYLRGNPSHQLGRWQQSPAVCRD